MAFQGVPLCFRVVLGRYGALLGALGTLLGRFLDALGRSWRVQASKLAPRVPKLAPRGHFWSIFRAISGRFLVDFRGHFWSIFGCQLTQLCPDVPVREAKLNLPRCLQLLRRARQPLAHSMRFAIVMLA